MKRILIIGLLLISSLYSFAQRGSGFASGIEGSALFNSATLPDLKVNTNVSDILEGKELVKGKVNYSDLTLNFRFGGFAKYDHGFGFALAELNLTSAKIKKDINTSILDYLGNYNNDLFTLERTLTYLDVSLSYNIYLSDNLFFGLGITPGLLIYYTKAQVPNRFDFRVFAGFGYKISDDISISTRAEFGITEAYKNSYIHHIMIPVTVRYSF